MHFVVWLFSIYIPVWTCECT